VNFSVDTASTRRTARHSPKARLREAGRREGLRRAVTRARVKIGVTVAGRSPPCLKRSVTVTPPTASPMSMGSFGQIGNHAGRRFRGDRARRDR
jgi:hypothetical protein